MPSFSKAASAPSSCAVLDRGLPGWLAQLDPVIAPAVRNAESVSATDYLARLARLRALARSVAPRLDAADVIAWRSASADWFIGAQAGSAQVGVLVGNVDLTSAASGRSVSIPGRWGTRLEAGRDPVLPRNWTQAEFDAFTYSTK